MKPLLSALFFSFISLVMKAQSSCDHNPADQFVICEIENTPSVSKPLVVFPNPTSDYFEIQNAQNTEGVLFDIQGRLLRKIDVTTSINISDLPNSLYFLKIDSSILKIIKQ